MTVMYLCHSCKRQLAIEKTISRRDECPFCGSDLHCCFNCTFYDRSAPKQCKEPIAEPVKEKAKANFCDFFFFVESSLSGTEGAAAEQARKALGDLFKK